MLHRKAVRTVRAALRSQLNGDSLLLFVETHQHCIRRFVHANGHTYTERCGDLIISCLIIHPPVRTPLALQYLVGSAVLVWGPLCDRYGRRVVYLVSLSMFVASSVVCAVAPNIAILIAFRAIQGASGGQRARGQAPR